MTKIKLVVSYNSFGGEQRIYSHLSKECDCEMKFAIYLPPQAKDSAEKFPVLYWLSGLSCDENNFIQKAGAQRYAAEHGLIIVCPDTSPRVKLYGDDECYDFGKAASFYLDAITEPWKDHYKMFSYITKELIEVINHNFPILEGAQSISGHSMGGHGALICALRCPGLYKSVSAFAPIANLTQCPWGKKALRGYIGDNRRLWHEWDATDLATEYKGPPLEILIDQGSADQFLQEEQLLPENLIDACRKSNIACIYKKRDGYDHGYYFIASFIGEHIAYHANSLKE